MKTINTTNYTIVLYDSIRELPAERDTAMNYYLLEDSGIGTDINSIDGHLLKISIAANENKLADIQQAIDNLKACWFAQIAGYRPDYLAWACMIHSINGELLADTSTENLKALVKKLSDDGLTVEQISSSIDELKKNYPRTGDSLP